MATCQSVQRSKDIVRELERRAETCWEHAQGYIADANTLIAAVRAARVVADEEERQYLAQGNTLDELDES